MLDALIERLKAEYPDADIMVRDNMLMPGRTGIFLRFRRNDQTYAMNLETIDDVLISTSVQEYIDYLVESLRQTYEDMQLKYPDFELS